MKEVDKIRDFEVETQRPNEDGYIEHLICEGSRRHVLSWDTKGVRCSEKNCEYNKDRGGEED